MRKDTYPPGYVKQVTSRLKWAREKLRPKVSQNDVAKAVGIERDTYRTYEQRTPLPQHLVVPVCTLLGISPVWLLSGDGEAFVTQVRADLRAVK